MTADTNRRDFLSLAAATGAGLALGGLTRRPPPPPLRPLSVAPPSARCARSTPAR